MNSNFQTAYERLNEQQKKAVDAIEGPVMVVAGPGTGKTQVLSTRIAKILQIQDVNPENILALTFTDAAAQNMRQRVVSLIGVDGYSIAITTFHSFASEVLTTHPEKFPIQKTSQPLSEYERFEVFEYLLTNSNLRVLKPLQSPLHYLKDVVSKISQLKREYITPEKFEAILESEEQHITQEVAEYWEAQTQAAQLGKKAKTKLSAALLKKQRDLLKQKDLYTVYVKYESELRKRKRYDFDDMILFVIQAFSEDEELLLDYQERFQYILVDEYQDTNASQNKILQLLCSFWEEKPNIFVVGDPHQAIFRFQGASVHNMIEFAQTYPELETITLTTGYRCHQEIYDAAHELIQSNQLQLTMQDKKVQSVLQTAVQHKLTSAKKSNKDTVIEFFQAESEVMELVFVVQKIQELSESGVPLKEIAVLYRGNKEAGTIGELLEKWGIEYELSAGTNALENPLILQLLNFLAVIQQVSLATQSELFFEVMQYDWVGLPKLGAYKLAAIAGKMRLSISDVLALPYAQLTHTYELSDREFAEFSTFKQRLLEWYQLSKNMLFHEWLSLMLSSTSMQGTLQGFGLIQYIVTQPVKTQHLLAFNTLFTMSREFVSSDRLFSLDDLLKKVAIMKEHGVKLPVAAVTQTAQKVILSTAHSAKGKEWDYVFIIGAVDKKWGNSIHKELLPLPESIITSVDIGTKEKNEDDRRLFYVALTRASKKMYLSYSKLRSDGKDLLPTLFTTQIAAHLHAPPAQFVTQIHEQTQQALEQILTTPEHTLVNKSKQEIEFFTQLVSEFKLSVTALNSYLKNPEEFLFNSLLRIPKVATPSLCFGTAVHFALEQFYRKLQQHTLLSYEEISALFEQKLSQELLTSLDFTDRLQHGKEILAFYYNEVLANTDIQQASARVVFIERFFGGSLTPVSLFDNEFEIKLSGRIDRVDIIDSQEKTVKIIDYKTGKSKSKNVLLGQTSLSDYSQRELELPETIRGRLQRQMVFYKLLCELDPSFTYNLAEVEFDFIEPTGTHKDSHVCHTFTVSDQAVLDLKATIIEVMREIRSLQFFDKN